MIASRLHSLRKFETLALNLEAPLSRLRNAFRARCAHDLTLAVHPLPAMLAAAWHPDQSGNVPHHELADNPSLLDALLPPPPLSPKPPASSSAQARGGASNGARGSANGGARSKEKAEKEESKADKWRPLLTMSEATRLLYALDPQGVGRINLPLLASLVRVVEVDYTLDNDERMRERIFASFVRFALQLYFLRLLFFACVVCAFMNIILGDRRL